MISLVINLDTRQGLYNDVSQIGDFGSGSLQGARSIDFLTDGVVQKIKFFRGYPIELILFVDEVEKIDKSIFAPFNAKLICEPFDHSKYRWNDLLYVAALKHATGDYIVHIDSDTSLYRSDDSDIIEQYIKLLETNIKYVCQPSSIKDHGMLHASTRFFICKKKTLNLDEVLKCFNTQYLISKYPWEGVPHFPCLEHVLGAMVGKGNVLYPAPENDKYVIFSWVRYYKGVLAKLNNMGYKDVYNYISSCGGMHGPNDVIGVPI